MSLTTDPNDPRLGKGTNDKPVPQNEVYLVLSEEEIAKGFVRPVRDKYIHVGRSLNYKGIWRMLSDEDKKVYPDKFGKSYVAVMTVLTNEDGKPTGGSYVTEEEFNAWKDGKTIGGCGGETVMGQALAETYARDPKFYGATYCVHCSKHLPVSEFIWSNTNETVGS